MHASHINVYFAEIFSKNIFGIINVIRCVLYVHCDPNFLDVDYGDYVTLAIFPVITYSFT